MRGELKMKRIIPVLAALLVFSLSASLAAQENGISEAYGLPLLGNKDEDGRTFLVLGEKGSEILLSVDAEPSEDRIQALKSLAASLRANPDISINEIRAINSADRLVVLVLPSKLMASTADCASSLPGGLQFTYSFNYEYDFRILAGGRYLRMSGLYTDFSMLQRSISEVLNDPAAYAVKMDPLATAREAEELEARVARLEAALIASINGGKALPQGALEKLRAYRKADPSLTKAAALAKLNSEGIPLSSHELDIAFSVLFGE